MPKKTFKLNRAFIINSCVFFLFIGLNIYELVSDPLRERFRIIFLIIISMGTFLCCCKKINMKIVIMFLICFLTGLLNYIYIGNMRIPYLIYIAVYIVASLLLLDDKLNPKIPLIAIYINIAIIIYRFLNLGIFQRVYNVSSNNFISVYLLLPMVVYYTIEEKRGEQIKLLPALFVWIMSLLGLGRGGIICSSCFIIGLIIVKFNNNKAKNKLILMVLCISIVFLGLPFWSGIEKYLFTDNVLFSGFAKRGLNNDARSVIWTDYLIKAGKSWRNIFLGGSLSGTVANVYYMGNVHNSFLNIHVYNGIIPLIVIIGMIIANIKKAIKCKYWIYCLCVLVVFMRIFTDTVFWLNLETPILFYFIFFSFNSPYYSKINIE